MYGASISLKKIGSSVPSIGDNYSPLKTAMILLEEQLQKHQQTTKLETQEEPVFPRGFIISLNMM